ncbi:uncharacterized protein [Cherax quadricarinatus]|uniref:uncharacterized protein n=1 Tax=Cherax quadricarinatus TaxID=27406 RepID=UPI002379C97A|nr:uncharacterized protein LOC128698488 [Cherax quadricarinatus]
MQFLASRYPQLLMIGDNLERTPLHYAMAVEGVDQVATVLVQAGAKRTLKDLRDHTPSANFIHPEAVRALQKEEQALMDLNQQALPASKSEVDIATTANSTGYFAGYLFYVCVAHWIILRS